MAEDKVTIKRGMMNFESPRNQLISCTETPDGISFKFKEGLIVTVDDLNMPSSVKQRICIADTSFTKGSLIFNLNDYRTPVSLSL